MIIFATYVIMVAHSDVIGLITGPNSLDFSYALNAFNRYVYP